MRAVVGSTGFVGSNLARQRPFDIGYNRANIQQASNQPYGLLVCAGLPATKWLANAEPAADRENFLALWSVLQTVTADRAVLISTVDVYDPPRQVDEHTSCDNVNAHPYGRHRAEFEALFRDHFPNHLVLRLPGLFGPGLRKNLIFDLAHNRHDQYQSMNPRSQFQFFNVEDTWAVIDAATQAHIRLLNVAVEPVTAAEVAGIFDVELNGTSEPAHYDVKTCHAASWGRTDGYLYGREYCLGGISAVAAQSLRQ